VNRVQARLAYWHAVCSSLARQQKREERRKAMKIKTNIKAGATKKKQQ
jgi:hypothetical protein